MNQLSSAVEGMPGFGFVSDAYGDFAGEHFKTKDPFYVEIDGKQKRRLVPRGLNPEQERQWKSIINKAWYHDRNFCACGCGCVGIDFSLGILPIVSIIPVLGPIWAYVIRSSLIKRCADAGLPVKEQAIMGSNILADFIISLVPLLGVLFCWLYASSTRNAAIFDTWMRKQGNRVLDIQRRERENQAEGVDAAELSNLVVVPERRDLPPQQQQQQQLVVPERAAYNNSQTAKTQLPRRDMHFETRQTRPPNQRPQGPHRIPAPAPASAPASAQAQAQAQAPPQLATANDVRYQFNYS